MILDSIMVSVAVMIIRSLQKMRLILNQLNLKIDSLAGLYRIVEKYKY